MKAVLSYTKSLSEKSNITITGSKSETNRVLVLQKYFPNIHIENGSKSDDSKALIAGLKITNGEVNIHHAGTAMRFLTAYFASKEHADVVLTGSERMLQRPIKILVDALTEMGANIKYLKKDGYPPLHICGKKLDATSVNIDTGVSSQYISALMLIGPVMPKGLHINLVGKKISRPYINMTAALLQKMGVQVDHQVDKIRIEPKRKVPNINVYVESDWSSASYFYSLTALSSANISITLYTFLEESYQGDSALAIIYRSLGVDTSFDRVNRCISLSKMNRGLPEHLMLDLQDTPDLAQTIAVSCFGMGLGCSLTGLQTLKIKETDRLVAIKTELEKLGATIVVDEDSLELAPSKSIASNVSINTYDDHRMAMAFAQLALKTSLLIENAEVVAKSFPTFWDDMKKVGLDVTLESL